MASAKPGELVSNSRPEIEYLSCCTAVPGSTVDDGMAEHQRAGAARSRSRFSSGAGTSTDRGEGAALSYTFTLID